MKERIYSIPLTEVLVRGQGCPFCLLAAKAEAALLRVYLDGMLADAGWRGRVLEEWLCRRHLAGLQSQIRKLGGAIVVQAMLRRVLTDLGERTLPDWGASCVACRDIGRTVLHHVKAFVQTWFAEPDFQRLAFSADPFCLPHLAALDREANRLAARPRAELRRELRGLAEKTLSSLLGEVDWFVQKFDARFQDASWHGTEDAVERAVGILTGR